MIKLTQVSVLRFGATSKACEHSEPVMGRVLGLEAVPAPSPLKAYLVPISQITPRHKGLATWPRPRTSSAAPGLALSH